jgi:hypothetical protein
VSDLDDKKRTLTPKEIHKAVKAMLDLVKDSDDLKVAVAGGVAMQIYGSRRKTTDVDFLGNWTLGPQDTFKMDHPLSFGGMAYVLAPDIIVDVIVRNDVYKDLYDEALLTAEAIDGVPVITPDHLAAMKFLANREKDRVDLAWLLKSGLVNVDRVGDILDRTLDKPEARGIWHKRVSRIRKALDRYAREGEDA